MIFEMIGGEAKEYIKIDIQSEELEELRRNTIKNRIQFIDKTPIEIEVGDSGGIEYPDCINEPLPLFSDRLKNILESNNIDNIFYKPIYLVDTLLEEKHLYWLASIPQIECFTGNEIEYMPEKIGNFKIFRDKLQDDYSIYVTEELKNILENEELEGIIFYNITKI